MKNKNTSQISKTQILVVISFLLILAILPSIPKLIYNLNVKPDIVIGPNNEFDVPFQSQNNNNYYDQAFIGVSPDKKYDNETLDVLNTSNPIYVYLDDNMSERNPYKLILSDLSQFFGYRYGTKIIRVDDDLAYSMGGVLNNSIIIGNETINNATNWLANFAGFNTNTYSPGVNGFDMRTFQVLGNSCVVIRGADKFGDASAIYWLIDRCRTQPRGEVNLTAFRTPDLAFRMTSVYVDVPTSSDSPDKAQSIMNGSYEAINGAIRRGANKILISGDYKFIAQYPFLCNYSWNVEIQKRLESSWNLTELEYRRKYVNDILEYIDSMGADSYFWADQLHVLSPKIKDWLLEAGDIDIRNNRVKELLQGQLREIFSTYKKIDGIMLRVGDDLYCYGDDPHFKYGMKLMYSPRTFRESTQAMMEVVKEFNKTMVLRTWQMSVRDDCVHASVKAYDEAFGDLYYKENELIICAKYTPNDYQRIPINPTLNRGSIKQIVEFQTINSFENYQYTPLCMATTYLDVLKNLTTTTNATGSNLLIGYFNIWGHERDLKTSDLEGPGAETDYRREGQFYFMQRSSWNINLSLVEFSKDLAAKQLGREKEIRDNFWKWYNLSDRVHWHLLYLPYHRENAPWLKSRWLHYSRYIKADPQAFGYIYYFCRQNISAVIESVEKGRQLAYEMKYLIENVSPYVSPQNQKYLQYHLNKANLMVDFAELAYWYIRTAMHWWKYMETADFRMRAEAFNDLPNLKSALNHFNSTYHYYWETPSGHKIGLQEVYAFIHWIEVSNLNTSIGFIIGLLIFALLIITLGFKKISDKSRFTKMLRITFIHPSKIRENLTRRFIMKENEGSLAEIKEERNKKFNSDNWETFLSILEPVILLISIPILGGLLISSISFWQYPAISMSLAFMTIFSAQSPIFIISLLRGRKLQNSCRNGQYKEINEDRKKSNIRPSLIGIKTPIIYALSMTAYVSSVALPIIGIFFIYIGLVTPLGVFTGPWIIRALEEPRFLSFTPISIEFLIFLIMMILTIIWVISIGVTNTFESKSKPAKYFIGFTIFILMILFSALSFLARFPNFLNDIDFYLNHLLGTYCPINFFG
ncbi:MAG: hypothetical protein ACTSU2_16685 [Promethearchaeota archaeon]